jgi:hypothetical protein
VVGWRCGEAAGRSEELFVRKEEDEEEEGRSHQPEEEEEGRRGRATGCVAREEEER